jgi:hypothetical protein
LQEQRRICDFSRLGSGSVEAKRSAARGMRMSSFFCEQTFCQQPIYILNYNLLFWKRESSWAKTLLASCFATRKASLNKAGGKMNLGEEMCHGARVILSNALPLQLTLWFLNIN